MEKKTVFVGLSGGVDSSVAAYLLQKDYHVVGVFMKNWHQSDLIKEEECPWIEDSNDALEVAEHLGIPFRVVDFSQAYRQQVVDYMFHEYQQGRTPNPDILCNREIKFKVFLEKCLSLGADLVATGHYCQVKHIDNEYRLIAGTDKKKDQSYFLCQLNQKQLSKALFPIGHLEKPKVRQIARKAGLHVFGKKDSQGLCFVGKINLPIFLSQKLKPSEGKVILIPHQTPKKNDALHYILHEQMGKEIGTHQGTHFLTIGQRKGLNIGGFAQPLYVLGTDVAKNLVFVGEGEQHPYLWRTDLYVKTSIHWVRNLKLQVGDTLSVMARIRYRQPLQKATLEVFSDKIQLTFEKPISAITPGQFAAWYIENELVGSGEIS